MGSYDSDVYKSDHYIWRFLCGVGIFVAEFGLAYELTYAPVPLAIVILIMLCLGIAGFFFDHYLVTRLTPNALIIRRTKYQALPASKRLSKQVQNWLNSIFGLGILIWMCMPTSIFGAAPKLHGMVGAVASILGFGLARIVTEPYLDGNPMPDADIPPPYQPPPVSAPNNDAPSGPAAP